MTTFTLKKTYASLPRTARGQPIVINGDPKGKNFLYCNGNNVFIRNITETSECDVYSEHSKETTMAKYSPSGFYIASGDVSGKVRVWDTVNPEHILKIEHPALAGAIKDLDWTADSQKLIVGGESREFFGRAFTFDSGNTVGEIKGHSKSINSVSIKQNRPFRAVTGSEDFACVFFEGPPFKFVCSKTEHTNFVNCVRYSPDGSKFISGGADGKLYLYDGKTSDLIGELGAPRAHDGGVYAICYNADGSKLLSVSGDKTAKIWNLEDSSVENVFALGKQVLDMQVGCLWQGDTIITVSLSGYFNFLDPANPAAPKRIIKGHNKPIVALAVSPDGSNFCTASSDGVIVSWNAVTSENDDFKGKGHTNQVMDMALDGDTLVSVGIDDTVRFTPSTSDQYSGDSVKLDSQPRGVDSRNGTTVIACQRHVIVFENGKKVSSMPVQFEGLSVSIHPGMSEVAVGSKTQIHIFSLSGGTLTEIRSEPAEEVTTLAYSPDGAFLAVGSKSRVMMFKLEDWTELISLWGEQHTAKVTSVQWSPDSRRFASGSVDSHIIIWDQGRQTMGKRPSVKAHPLSHINRIGWLDNNTIITAGQDSNIKIWQVSD